jgi:hypothetical protein
MKAVVLDTHMLSRSCLNTASSAGFSSRLVVVLPDTLDIDRLSKARIRFVPVLLIMPVLIVFQSIDDRIKGVIHTLPGKDILCLLVQLIADRILIGSGSCNQEEQWLLSGITRPLRQNVIELSCRLGVNLIEDKPGYIQPCFVPTSAEST